MAHESDVWRMNQILWRMNLSFMAHGAEIDLAGPRLGLRKPSHGFHTTHINLGVTLAAAILLGDANTQDSPSYVPHEPRPQRQGAVNLCKRRRWRPPHTRGEYRYPSYIECISPPLPHPGPPPPLFPSDRIPGNWPGGPTARL